jgi:hypothetical protein
MYFREGRDKERILREMRRMAALHGLGDNPTEIWVALAEGSLELCKPVKAEGPPKALVDALHADLKLDLEGISKTELKEALARAAAQACRFISREVQVYREIAEEDGRPFVLVDLGEGERLFLGADDTDTLRAALMTIDESAPPLPGEPLLAPMRDGDTITSVVTHSLLVEWGFADE